MKRAIVTGATGFVGANLARRLLSDGHEVHLLVRPDCERWRLEALHMDVRYWQADLTDGDAVRLAVQTIKPDWIFHLAAFGAYPSQTGLNRMIEVNVLGTVNLVKSSLASGFEAFVNTGSSSEYGFKSHPSSESDFLEPNSDYAWTKASQTTYCQHAARTAGANITTLRLYSVYGPLERPSRLMPTLITRGLRGELPPLTKPSVARDYVYITDVLDAYLKAAGKTHPDAGAIYNVGTGIQTSLAEIVEIATERLGVKAQPEWESMPGRIWDTNVWTCDNRKIQNVLGWRPSVSVKEGFGRFADWLEQTPGVLPLYEVLAA